jgi:hypothetical protein
MVADLSDRSSLLRATRWLPVLVWGVAGAACCYLVSGFEPNLLEEGIGLHVAQRLAHGERLYRDIVAYLGPLPFELLAFLFRRFGEEIWIARSFVIALHGLATGAAFALVRGGRPGPLAHAAAAVWASAPLTLFPLFSIYYYTTIAAHLSVLAAWAAWRGTRSSGWAFAAGVGVAAVALCKQNIGVGLAATLGIGLLLVEPAAGRMRRALAFSAGGAAAALLTLGAWAVSGSLGDAVYGLVTLPASLEESFDLPYINLFPPGRLSLAATASQTFYLPYFVILVQGIFLEPSSRVILVTQALYAVPLFAAVVTAVRFALRRSSPAAVIHGMLFIAWLWNLFPRTDWGHLVHVLPFAAAQLILALPGAPSRMRWQRPATAALAAVLVGVFGLGTALAWRIIEGYSDPGPLGARVPLRPVSSPLRQMHVRSVIEFIEDHSRPDEYIFVARAEPLLYFATGRRNPTPYTGVLPMLRDEQQRTILAALERVRFVVMSDVDQPAMTYYRDELPLVQAYLERFFQPAPPFADGEFHWLNVLERGPDRGATAIDLVTLAPAGRPFVRDRSAQIEPAPPLPDRLATRRNRRPLGFQLGPGGGGIDFELEIPAGAVFQADASLGTVFSENEIFKTPPRSRLVVSIGSPDEMTTLVEQKLDAGTSLRWIPLEADLAAWAGRRMTLRIELIRADLRITPFVPLGYVGSPRIARRETPGSSEGM